jgi:hypothetical protein
MYSRARTAKSKVRLDVVLIAKSTFVTIASTQSMPRG